MIIKIDNTNFNISEEIYPVFQSAYTVESKILKAFDFPPLQRTIDDLTKSSNDFYAYLL